MPDTIPKWCRNCDHPTALHGDRVLGVCSAGMYPQRCECPGWSGRDIPERNVEDEIPTTRGGHTPDSFHHAFSDHHIPAHLRNMVAGDVPWGLGGTGPPLPDTPAPRQGSGG